MVTSFKGIGGSVNESCKDIWFQSLTIQSIDLPENYYHELSNILEKLGIQVDNIPSLWNDLALLL